MTTVPVAREAGRGISFFVMGVLVKICGITSVADALLAVELGADLLGVIGVESSPRYTPPETLKAIVTAVGSIPVVSVVRRATEAHAAGECLIQFYEGPAPLPLPGIQVVRVRDAQSLAPVATPLAVQAVLLDTYHEKALGGVGQRFDWSLAVAAKALCPLPLYLAGGLTPENVAEAVQLVRPALVDVASGVEAAPGKKDPSRLRDFIAAAKAA